MKVWLSIVPGMTGVAVGIAMFMCQPSTAAVCVVTGSIAWLVAGMVVYTVQGG